MAVYYTYALKSVVHNYIYVGITDNPERRLQQHNRGWSRATKPYLPLFLFYLEEHPDRQSARKREIYFKNSSGKTLLRRILQSYEEKLELNNEVTLVPACLSDASQTGSIPAPGTKPT